MFVALGAAIAGCARDETVSGYAAPGSWRLAALHGEPVSTMATLRFPREGRVAGSLPCGAFSAQQTAPYPWFLLSHFSVPSGCPDDAEEARVIRALAAATLAEAQGGVLILSNDEGLEMVLRLRDG